VYRDAAGDFYRAMGEVNREVEVFPAGRGCRFEKRRHWERLTRPWLLGRGDFGPVAFYELKFVLEPEFDHWSTVDWPSERKRREWRNFHLVKEGRVGGGRFESLGPGFLDDQLR